MRVYRSAGILSRSGDFSAVVSKGLAQPFMKSLVVVDLEWRAASSLPAATGAGRSRSCDSLRVQRDYALGIS